MSGPRQYSAGSPPAWYWGVVRGIGRARDAGSHCGARHRRRHGLNQAWVERRGDDVVRPEAEPVEPVGLEHLGWHRRVRQFGERMHRADLHFARDAPGAHVERAAEDERKAEHVVDLVRVVRAPGGHDQVLARGVGELGADLGVGVGEREHHRPAGHGLEHLRGQQVRGRDAHEHVGTAQRVGERTQGRGMRELAFVDIQVVARGWITPLLSTRVMCSLVAPSATSRRMEVMPAAPAPRQTMRASESFLAPEVPARLTTRRRQSPRCHAGRRGIPGCRDAPPSASSITKHSGAAMSSRLMPPKVGAIAATVSMNASIVGALTSMSNTSMPAKCLNSTPLPSSTGLAASAPRLPSPRIAVPLLMTATRLPLLV